MHKKNVKKLVLSRETLQNLDRVRLGDAVGAVSFTCPPTVNTWDKSLCYVCPLK
jgi:hypothetical protein